MGVVEHVDDTDSRVDTSTDETARSASRDNPDDDGERTNPVRPSEDSVDTTGDDKHRPDTPTGLPTYLRAQGTEMAR